MSESLILQRPVIQVPDKTAKAVEQNVPINLKRSRTRTYFSCISVWHWFIILSTFHFYWIYYSLLRIPLDDMDYL